MRKETKMSSNLKDERGALPSASRMTRIFNCPASFKLNAMEMPETSASAEEGKTLHRVCELTIKTRTNDEEAEFKELISTLTDEQAQIVAYATQIVEKYKTDSFAIECELRLWDNDKLFSGQGDVLITYPNGDALIVDYKFGRGEVEPAERNYQLSALASLVYQNVENIKRVRAMIIQPRAFDKTKRITECEYSVGDLKVATEQLRQACKEAIESVEPKSKCGYWCNYCKSSYRCKQAQDMISQQHKLAISNPSIAVGQHNVVEMFQKASVVKKLCEDILSNCKNWIMKNPDHNTRLVLQQGAKRAKLGDANDIFLLLENEIGIQPSEFVGCCAVEIGKVSSLYHEKRKAVNEKQTKKASDIEVRELLENSKLLTYSQSATSLKLLDEDLM